MEEVIRELALFAGAGGGLHTSRTLGWRTVAAVERDPFARGSLLEQQRDGDLDIFPIWDDVCTFDGRAWRHRVDVVSGGFPCQAHSTASRGRRVAEDLWPQMLRIIHEVQPSWVFAENVQKSPIECAAEDLRRLGYYVRFAKIGSAHVGAPHERPRWWLVADADNPGQCSEPEHGKVAGVQEAASLRWSNPPPGGVLGVDDGMANRGNRMRCIGNGQCPQVAALAWRFLRGCTLTDDQVRSHR